MKLPPPLQTTRRWIAWLLCGFTLLAAPILAQETGDTPRPAFTPAAENPIISRSGDGWGGECGTIFAPQVIFHEDQFYMFYSGSCGRTGRPAALGYATSPDGLHWTANESNPILEPDGEGYDAMCVSIGVPTVDGDQWVIYYAGNSTPCAGPGQHIGRATASSPNGPWERSAEPILDAGTEHDWDAGFVMPHAVIHTDDGYIMYYSGGQEYLLPLPRLIGIATSVDGIVWTKYDDPATTADPYANSDPILEVSADGTETPLSAWAIDVEYTDRGWEMIFSTSCPEGLSLGCPTFIGYGSSDDGIHWQLYRAREQAVLTRPQVDADWASHCVCQPSFVKTEAEYLLYFTGCTDETNNCQIGLASGTIDWESP